jgi:hypothetical protein
MLDEQQEAPAAEDEDDAVDVADAGGDDAVDLAALGAEVQTADEPAVTAEELMEIPDAPETPGPEELTHARAQEASDLGAQAASEEAGAGPDAGAEDAGAAPEAGAAEDAGAADAAPEGDA